MRTNLDVTFKDEANIEVIEAYVYYENELLGLGERFLQEFDRVILDINLSPNGFKKFTENTRQVPMAIFPYVIIYEVIKKSLIIYAVFQTNQDPIKKNRSTNKI
jgi:hypothetical protein